MPASSQYAQDTTGHKVRARSTTPSACICSLLNACTWHLIKCVFCALVPSAVAALAANPKKFIKKPANKGKQARADQQREEALQRQQLLFRQEAPVDPPPDGQAAVRARRAQAADGSQEPEPGDQLTGTPRLSNSHTQSSFTVSHGCL